MVRLGIYAVIAAVIGIGNASQADEAIAPSPPLITHAKVYAAPTLVDLQYYYPTLALRMGKSGSATLHCIVSSAGALTNCAFSAETPTGLGFGAAALKLAELIRLGPVTETGMSTTGGVYVTRIEFKLAK